MIEKYTRSDLSFTKYRIKDRPHLSGGREAKVRPIDSMMVALDQLVERFILLWDDRNGGISKDRNSSI